MKKKKPAARALELVTSIPWAITEEYLRTIVNVAAREDIFPTALTLKEGEQVQGRDMEVRDGVAVIPVTGPIFRRANLFTMISGGTSTEWLAADFGAALRDPQVHSIVLDIDSPGGELNGLSELQEAIFRARGEKPVIAYVGDYACSGGYWLASAASAIIASPTGLLGSIGVLSTYLDDREHLEQEGFREIKIVSSQSPKKSPDPASTDGRAQVQRLVDELAAVFVGDVARNRAVTPETVLAEFGAGDVLLARAAVEADMADQVATFEDVIAALQAVHRGEAFTVSITPPIADPAALAAVVVAELGAALATDPEPADPEGPSPKSLEESMKDDEKTTPEATEQPEITVAYIEENHAALAEHFRAEGRKAGATEERDRIKSIEALGPGHEAQLDALKYDSEMTAEKAALEIVQASKEGQKSKMKALAADDDALPDIQPSTDPEQPSSEQQDVKRTLALHAASHGRKLPA